MTSSPPPNLQVFNFAQYALADPTKLVTNMAKAFEITNKISKSLSERADLRQQEQDAQVVPIAQVTKTLQQVAQDHMTRPDDLMAAQKQLWEQYTQIWNNAWARSMGQVVEPVAQPSKSDRRFKDEDWSQNIAFDSLKQAYLVTSNWMHSMVQGATGVDEHTKRKARFYVENIVNAFSPSNFMMTNPEVVKATLSSNGENIIRGLEKLAKDLDQPDGRLRISQVDKSAFKLGENIATTPGKVIFRNDIFELIQYSPAGARAFEIPLLIIPPWINKFYIFDLTAQKSFVRYCVENGLTVFIVSWCNDSATTSKQSFESYIKNGLMEAITAATQASGQEKLNIMGFCIGGTLLAAGLAHLAALDDKRINSATFLTTQVDFQKAGDLLVYVDEEQVEWIESRINEKGYLPGGRMADAFNLLRSNDLIWSFVVNNYLLGKDPLPFDLLFWNSDSTRMPGAVHSFYLRQCYLYNKLANRELTVDGMAIDLSRIKVPIYNLACKDDHIAPAASVFKLAQFMGGETTTVISGSGHVAGVINPPAAQKYNHWTNTSNATTLEGWMATAEEHAGSWWANWMGWIAEKSGDKIAAPIPGEGAHKAICDAPGEYVRVQGVL